MALCLFTNCTGIIKKTIGIGKTLLSIKLIKYKNFSDCFFEQIDRILLYKDLILKKVIYLILLLASKITIVE